LIGFSALAIRPPLIAEGVVITEVTEADATEMEERLANKGKWFKNVVSSDSLNTEWRTALDFPTDALAREARAADIVVIGRERGPGDVYNTVEPASVILRAGRPILVIPTDVSEFRGEHVLIGWKDVREARRAVVDAMPFLQKARRVTIAEVCEPDEEKAAQRNLDDVIRFLARHEIRSESRLALIHSGSGADRLIRLAQEEGADLVVTGAYGHSRLGEWVFGGVTRELLASSPICCLMSH
jgi:nucleotide-binding universal stress UspA family protein